MIVPEPTILDEILLHKRSELEILRSRTDLAELKSRCGDAAPARDFADALKAPRGRLGLIAEVKKASPSAGLISPDFDPVAIAHQYESAGADCLSVLTDFKYFQGCIADMQAARAATGLPVLRKDFVVDEYQVYEARAAGADCVLLIVAALTDSQVADYLACAQELGMAVLVETHTEEEMQVALGARAKLIGINSRNLKSFVTDLSVVDRLAHQAPEDAILVAESGIKNRADVDRVMAAGARAILVGETLMRAGDVHTGIRALTA